MTTDRIERAARAMHPNFDRSEPAAKALVIDAMTRAAVLLFPELFSDPPSHWLAPMEATEGMFTAYLRALDECDAGKHPYSSRFHIVWAAMRDAHLKEPA